MSKLCLIVDDSKVIRKVARHILEALNYTVDEAGDGREALDACRVSVPDVILLDWNMPVMSGIEFLRAIEDDPLSSRPKIVFCTTENGTAHIMAAMDAGADEYIMKPFDRETLQTKLALVGLG
jgi:two-component system chemotaxis response regulator CheY